MGLVVLCLIKIITKEKLWQYKDWTAQPIRAEGAPQTSFVFQVLLLLPPQGLPYRGLLAGSHIVLLKIPLLCMAVSQHQTLEVYQPHCPGV